jgi:NADPH:quinone reductase-like Zn-dependent oxidoreductase
MLSINIPAYSKPSGYQLSELSMPEIQDPKDVLIKVHAASVNPVDVKKADGIVKFLQKDTYVHPN